MDNVDHDIRFMACADLTEALNAETLVWDTSSERIAAEKVFKLLNDNNGEVQNQAVKCLTALVPKLSAPTIVLYMNMVCELLKAELPAGQTRDIPSMALKAMITALPSTESDLSSLRGNFLQSTGKGEASLDGQIFRALAPELVNLLRKTCTAELLLDVLDNLSELFVKLNRYLDHNSSDQTATLISQIVDALFDLLQHSRSVVRRKTVSAFGPVVSSIREDALLGIVERLLGTLASSNATDDLERVKTFVFCLGTVVHYAPFRLYALTNRVFTTLECLYAHDDVELRQTTLLAIDSLLLRYPVECLSFADRIEKILHHAITLNLARDQDMASTASGSSEEDALDMFSEDDYQSSDDGDDDCSWKVKLAALQVLHSLVNNRLDYKNLVLDPLIPIILQSFIKEKEESLKTEFAMLLAQVTASSHSLPDNQMLAIVVAAEEAMSVKSGKAKGGPSVKLVVNCLRVFSALLQNKPQLVESRLHVWIPLLKCEISESESLLKNDRLNFDLRNLSSGFTVSGMKSSAFSLLEKLSIYRREIEVYWIDIACAIVNLVAPGSIMAAGTLAMAYKCLAALLPLPLPLEFVKSLEHSVTAFLCEKSDVEATNAALMAIPSILQIASDKENLLSRLIPLILEKLDSEVNRQSALDSLSTIADIGLRAPDLDSMYKSLCPLLRLSNWRLRQGALLNLEKWLNYGADERSINAIFEAVLPCIAEQTDLSIIPLSLSVTRQIVQQPAFPESYTAKIVDELLRLARIQQHWLTNTSCLAAYGALWDAVVSLPAAGIGYDDVKKHLSGRDTGSPSIARVYVAIALHASSALAEQCYKELVAAATKHGNTADGVAERVTAVIALGEIGLAKKLSDGVYDTVRECLKEENDSLKSAASIALGQIASLEPNWFDIALLQEISGQQGYAWLAARELLSTKARYPSLENELWSFALSFAASRDLSKVTSEVLGLCSDCVAKLVWRRDTWTDELFQLMHSANSTGRVLAIGCVQTLVTDKDLAKSMAPTLASLSLSVLQRVGDETLLVKRSALYALSVIVHENAGLLSGELDGLIHMLYDAATVNESLIQNVTIGPFKHKVDDGLEVRKAAFECLFALLENCPLNFDLFTFTDRVLVGVSDPSIDIQLLANQILQKLASVASLVVGTKLEALTQTYRVAFEDVATKAEKEKSDKEKLDDLAGAQAKTLMAVYQSVVLSNDISDQLPYRSKEMALAIPRPIINEFQDLLRLLSNPVNQQFCKFFWQL